jgi:O-antigen ligase
VAVLLAAAVFVGYFGPLGYAALAALGGLLLAPVALRPGRPGAEQLALLALAVLGAVSLAWSPAAAELGYGGYDQLEQNTAAKLFLQLAMYGLFVAGAARLSESHARRGLLVFSFGAAIWAGALLMDGVGGGRVWAALAGVVGQAPTLQFQEKKAAQGAYVLAVLAWPAIGFVRLRGWGALAVVLVVGVLVGSAGLSAYSAVLALFAGGAAYGLVRTLGRNGARLIGALLAGSVLLIPLVVVAADRAGLFGFIQEKLTASWGARTQIWSYAADRIAERPFLGWGLDASRLFGERIPLHPHDGPLQLWLELGVIGALVGAVFWLLLLRRIGGLSERSLEAAAVGAATATAYFVVGALSFGVWQEWWLATGALAAVLCTLYATVQRSEEARMEEGGLERL